MTALRCVYTDLDGTLLGAGASLLRDGDGGFTLAGARALEACHRAGVEVVFCSGRRRDSLFHDGRLLGVRSYVFEAGAGVVLDGETHWLTGALQPTPEASVHDQIAAGGAPALLLEAYAGRLEYHDPWHAEREVSHLFRGDVDATEADALLAAHGHDGLRLVDNGAIHRRMDGIERPHAYHLVPRTASKAGGVAAHMRMRGLAPQECIAVGDSREDAAIGAVVGTLWLVANAQPGLPGRRAEAPHGAGVYEAVMTELAERRG
jgi:hydroxymethylpyrimidine pyrophosphatase-like HAD family hydrolase